jgi:predicted HTH domain antitoxin
MRTLQLNIPDSLTISDMDLMMIVASKLYEDGRLSSGQAAELTGLSKRSFIELLGKYNVSVFGDSLDDLKSDIANA